MIILGLDPGTATTGYGVVETGRGVTAHVAHGVISTPAGDPLPDRLLAVYTQVNRVMDTYEPDAVATERLFFSRNVNTALSVGGVIGVLLLSAAQRGLDWAEYRPAEVKMAVVGFGAAEKQQVQFMVQQLLKLPERPRPDDAADALAIAICHAHSAALSSM